MEDLCQYANRPWAFVGRYLRRRIVPHLVILFAVLGSLIVLFVYGAVTGRKGTRA